MASSGCAGSRAQDEAVDDGGSDDGGQSDDAEPLGCEQGIELGSAPLRRLTRNEYDNTVRDLLGDDTRPASAFAADDTALGFAVAGHVSLLVAQHYMDAAEAIAARATADLTALLPCDPEPDEQACIGMFIGQLAPRAYRRPLVDDEHAQLMALYNAARSDFDRATAVATVLEAVLQSPHFLYRVEVGAPDPDGDGIVALGSHELATRLSYLVWNTMPDAGLAVAAATGQLDSREGLEAEVRRMLDDPRARTAVDDFHRQWLGMEALRHADKDLDLHREWDDALRDAMIAEVGQFAQAVVFEDDATLETLLTASYGFANEPLARVYGVPGVFGDALTRVELPPEQRAGLLTMAGLQARLASARGSDPIHRGLWVRERLLCQGLPAPPPDVDVVPPDPEPGASTRDQFEQHTADESCAGCHSLIDPIGFGFEHYDAVGAWRALDNGVTVDASGNVSATDDADGPFDGGVELARRLAASEQVRSCVATQWFRYAFARAEQPADDCTRSQIEDAFAAAGQDIRELLVALVLSDGFRFRRTTP